MKNKTFLIVILSLIIVIIGGISFVVLTDNQGTAAWREVRTRIYPQFVPAANKEMIEIVNKPFSEELDISIVLDEPERYVFVQKEALVAWGITEDELYDEALENLEKISEDINLQLFQSGEQESGKYLLLEVPDGYAAIRLLSENVRRLVANELGNNFLAAIPTRDFLIFWREDFPYAVEFLEQVRVEFEAEEKYRLSQNLFKVSPQGIQPVQAVAK